MNVVTSLKKGKQKLIYMSGTRMHSFPENIKGYSVKVQNVKSNNVVELTDLGAKEVEKGFHLHQILEVLDDETTDSELDERVKWHKDNFLEYSKPLKSFELSKGFLFKKTCSASYDGETVNINLGNYPSDITRDIHIFRFLCGIIKDGEPCNLSDCKNFDSIAKSVFPDKFEGPYGDKRYFKDNFTKEYKDDYIEDYQSQVEDCKESIQEVKEDNELTPAEKKEAIEHQELEKELHIAKEKLAIVKKDMREFLASWFCHEFSRKNSSSIFYALLTAFDILDFKKIV